MEAISRFIPSFLKKKGTGKFLKAVFKKSLVLMTVLAVIFSSFVTGFIKIAKAAAPTLSEATVVPASTVKASSGPKVIGAFTVTNPNVTADSIDQFTIENKAALTAVTADIASVAIYSDGGTLGVIDGADAVACAQSTTTTTTNFDAGGAVINFTCITPIAIGASATQNYLAVITTTVGATNGRTMAAKVNAHLVTAAAWAVSDLSTTNSTTIDTVAPSDPVAGNFVFIQNPPGTADQFAPKPATSVGVAGDTINVYAADGTTLLGQAVLGGSPVGFAPISIGDNTNASVKVQFIDPAGNASAQVPITGNDIIGPTITSATAFTDRIILNFSENVDGMQANNCSNYTVNGTALTCGGPGLPFIDFRGNQATIRGLTLSGTATLVITGGIIKDIDGGQNPLAAYNSGSLSVSALILPAISSISPSSAAVGDNITITGTNFGTGTAGDANHKVFFSGGFNSTTGPLPPIDADYTVATWSATSIAVKVPTGAQGGPVNIMVNGAMSDMGPNSFFDIKGNYTAKVYYGANNTSPMPDADAGNIRIAIMGMRGPVIYSTDGSSGNTMAYANGTPGTFTITGVASMGFTYAYDFTGTHLNSMGAQVNTSATQNLVMLATTRKISGNATMGASCVAGGQSKDVVVMAMPNVVDTSAPGFKEINPSFFRTNSSCVASYNLAIPVNGTYRVEAHIPSNPAATTVTSSAYTDPGSLQVTITDSTLTATSQNFTFAAATHKIMGLVQKPGGFGAGEKDMLWVFAYQPVENGKGTGTQVDASGNFTLNVSPGAWKLGVGGPNMPFPVEVSLTVDDTYLLTNYTAGTKTIVIAPPSDFIEGYVKDSAGNGLSNSSLYAWREGGPGGGNAKTDSQGYYKMYVSPGSNYHIGANSQSFGFLGEQSGITVSSSAHPTVNFTVSSANNFTISGTVTKSGQALQQAFVFITDGQKGPMLGSGGTDAAGAYTVKVSGGANRWLHVGLPAKGEIYIENLGTISANNTTKNITIVSSTIKVRISPASSFSDAFVGVHSDNGGGFSNTDVSSDVAYREYQIDVARPGSGSTTYYIDGGVPGFGPLSSVSVGVNSDGTFTGGGTDGGAGIRIVSITLGSLYTVSGTVSGANVLDAWVWASGPNGGNGAAVAANGSYSIKLKNGTYDIGVGKQDFIGNKISVTVNNADVPSQNLTLTSASQTITGTVYLPNGSTAVTNARVWADNGAGGWAGASTDGSGNYTLKVGSGSWTVKAAYDGYNSSGIVVTAPDTGKNITLAAISGFVPNTKNQPITPARGGTVQGTGIKVDFPKNALGTDTSAGGVEVKDTTNYTTNNATQIIGTPKEITARNSSNQTVTNITGNITIEQTVSKAQLISAGLTLDQAKKLKISSNSTSGAWVEIKTSPTLSVPTATTIADLSSDPAITFTGTTSHLSTYALTQSATGAPATPTGLTASAAASLINLNWTAVSGAAIYDIYSSTDGLTFPLLDSTADTSYTATSLTNGILYYFKVSAINSANKESAASSSASATPVAPLRVAVAYTPPAPATPTTTTTTPTTTTPTTTTPTTPTTPTTTTPTTPATPATPATPTTTTTTTATPSVSYPDGTLLKSSTDPRVYVIKNGQMVWIKTAREFKAGKYKWANVQTVSPDVLTQVGAAAPSASVSGTVKVVNTPTLKVRASNTAKSRILGKVAKNETFTILEEKNGWYKITTKTGVTGWISGAYAVKQ